MKAILRGIALAVVLYAITLPASSQNLIQNATFDSGIVPWAAGSFSTLDALASPNSGSIQATNNAATPFTYIDLVSECFQVVPGMTYDRRVDYRLDVTAGITGSAEANPGWYSGTNCSGFLGSPSNQIATIADGNWHTASDPPVVALSNAHSANVRLHITKLQAGGSVTANFDNVVFKAAGTCAPLPSLLCLNNNRFQVEANWDTGSNTGQARVVKLTSDTGYLWFFSSTNVEVVIKVLDACSFNQTYWVFAGGLTDQGVNITVTDTKSGAKNVYKNPRGTPFAPVQDTSAFATCP